VTECDCLRVSRIVGLCPHLNTCIACDGWVIGGLYCGGCDLENQKSAYRDSVPVTAHLRTMLLGYATLQLEEYVTELFNERRT